MSQKKKKKRCLHGLNAFPSVSRISYRSIWRTGQEDGSDPVLSSFYLFSNVVVVTTSRIRVEPGHIILLEVKLANTDAGPRVDSGVLSTSEEYQRTHCLFLLGFGFYYKGPSLLCAVKKDHIFLLWHMLLRFGLREMGALIPDRMFVWIHHGTY